MTDKTHGERMKAEILRIGVALWAAEMGVSASRIAAQMEMTHGAILYHFENADGLKNALAAHAVATDNSRVIIQLIALRHPSVANMTDADRQRHMRAAG